MVGSPYRRASGTDCVGGLRLDYRVKPDTEHAADASLDLWTQHGTVGGGNEAGAGLKWRWWRDDGGSPPAYPGSGQPPAEASASRAPRIRAASSREPADDRGDRRRGSDMIARDRCVRMADSAANRQAGVADFGRRHAARAVGRTPRAFAIAVWGAEAVAGEWGSDSWMRSQVRRWFPKARALDGGDWRDYVP